MISPRLLRASVLIATLAACAPPTGQPEVGSQTNWLVTCESSDTCGDLDCLCGTCTVTCESDLACSEFPGAVCVPRSDDDAVALCRGQLPQAAMCLPRCEQPCTEGTSCIAGICTPPLGAKVLMTIDPAVREQTLVGFGASLGFAETAIVSRPDKAALYDLMFAESGLDMLRFTNHFEQATDVVLQEAGEIVEAASQRMGHAPVLFMTSGTPPRALKANGMRTCSGDSATCTLVTGADGGFDYDGFAAHWRTSLEAYASAGVVPDYVSIQNHPNWVPTADARLEACRFLPEEGTIPVMVDGTSVEVRYPGYREAFSRVRAAISDLPGRPRLGAPEVSSPTLVGDFASLLDADTFDALAMHMYGMGTGSVDSLALEEVQMLADQMQRPVFQTEMRADGLTTATLIHHAITQGHAAAYLQNDFVALAPQEAAVSLVELTGTGFEAQAPYYALSHYAKHTDPGWVRIQAQLDADGFANGLLGSAWLAPDEGALTVVLVNPDVDDRWAELALPEALVSRFGAPQLTRTTFEGVDRAASLGELPQGQSVRVPGRSMVTVAFTSE